ncbi:nuclear transport factor 2 family protein [Levilactobacillus sp. N40-8-2]|uniref:nuclear transport factor 2 family protein n=1 Tax=Levilactobacillus muriae TaxID=3238987 RepID=UPI0038B2C0DC
MLMENTEAARIKLVCRQQIAGMISQDMPLLDRVISPEADFIHVTGEHQSKDDWLRQIKQGRMRYFDNQEDVLTVHVTGNQAHAIMKNKIEARIYGFRNTWPLTAQIDLEKHAAQWQIIRSQVTMY